MFGNLKKAASMEVRSRATGELFTVARRITDDTGIKDFSVSYEELLPGSRTSSPHFHSKKDEIYLVLSGSVSVYLNDKKEIINAGDYVVFKSGTRESHYLVNETKNKTELLMINSCPPDDIIEYQI